MRPFQYQRARTLDDATRLVSQDSTMAIAGGTNLLDLMKLQVETPGELADVNRIGFGEIEDTPDGGLRIGALATNTETAVHPRVRRDYPLLARAILAGATQQLRNKATTGGNLCQRTRCFYFMNIDQPCNKREPGSGCGAIDGVAKLHAVLGASDQCIATYPGDMAVAMSALDAQVSIVSGDGGERSVPVREFHCLPGDTPWRDNVLDQGEIITAVTLPAPVMGKQLYRKVRERSSYAFALVSVAAIFGKDGTARFAFGGIGAKPWRTAEGDAAAAQGAQAVAEATLAGARTTHDNDFKRPLVEKTLASLYRQQEARA